MKFNITTPWWALFVFAYVSCGAPEKPYFEAEAGTPCPGYGRSACDGRCTVICWGDGGVWEVDRCQPACGAELSTGVTEE